MHICVACKLNMVCTKNGIKILSDSGYNARFGDRYQCPKCKIETIIAADTTYNSAVPLKLDEFDLEIG